MNRAGRIVRVDPAAGIPGGEVVIECADLDTSNIRACGCRFGGERAHLVGLSTRRALALVPPLNAGGEIDVLLESGDEQSAPASFRMGSKLAEDLHPVANPAFDPDDGALYVTRSGSRGQHFPVSIFRIDTNGEIASFSGDITNPTGIAFDKTGQMFVTSRMDGTVYRITPFKEAVTFAGNLGVATGLAFDREGNMYVGDRTGTIYRINSIGEEKSWAQLEPSVSAYHLAFGPDDALYVTGPTVSSDDAVMRIDQNGEARIFYHGLGRPQGLAFDRDGNLYVAASMRGRRGVVRISPDGREAEMAVAGMNVIGLVFSAAGDMVVATNEAVYSLPLGIRGTLLS
ncbi:MAG: gluconolaconase [Acidobacteria bacterium]|nr:gluconolaconase [Acidobacteriota bacterium]